MEKIKNFLKNKKLLLVVFLVTFGISIVGFTIGSLFLGSIFYPISSSSQDYDVNQLGRGEILLNFINELKKGNKDIFEIFNLEDHNFRNITEEKVIEETDTLIKLSFFASTTGNSLHEYIYAFYFDNGKLLKVEEVN